MHALRRDPESGGGVIATCLDDKSILRQKYTDSKANVKRIEAAAGAVLYGVDGTCLHEREEFSVRRSRWPQISICAGGYSTLLTRSFSSSPIWDPVKKVLTEVCTSISTCSEASSRARVDA
mmetsp:Transcript_75838/g.173606  ORF Transcript_75838/g.173606 Transcript_75838/m.173606 type:complete len:121 (+) Transcript_75838:291-653(+)